MCPISRLSSFGILSHGLLDGIQWNLSLDLCDVFPQASDRAAMIWVDGQDMDSLRTESVRWPCVRMHTLRTFGVVGTWKQPWLECVTLQDAARVS